MKNPCFCCSSCEKAVTLHRQTKERGSQGSDKEVSDNDKRHYKEVSFSII